MVDQIYELCAMDVQPFSHFFLNHMSLTLI